MTVETLAQTAGAAGDDGSIARRIAGGDRVAFELLMRRHNRRLYRLARATLRDGAEAEDALQEAYLHAFRAMGQFRGNASLSTWLSRLVLNECLGRIRRHNRRENVIPMVRANEEVTEGCAATAESPDAAMARAQVRNLLERKVDELPDGFRTVFVMRSVEDLSVAETATVLGIPEETVRSRHFRAKSLLRAALEAQLGQAESDLFDFGGEHCDRVVAGVLARLKSL
jgi:RNA polymerase sigma factor (sigma-70 family)